MGAGYCVFLPLTEIKQWIKEKIGSKNRRVAQILEASDPKSPIWYQKEI